MKALAAPDDAQLAGWLAKIEASNLRIADLRQRLAQALDQPGDLAVDLLSQCATWLGEYRSLVSPDDGRLLAWDRRLPAEHQAVEALKRTLSRLDQETPLTLAEQAACHKAFDGLVARAALGPEVKARIVRRLIDEADHVAALRAALARHRQEKSGVSDSLRTALADLAAVTGSEDSDVLAWQSVVAEHDRRRAQLAALDRVESLPDDAEASCARLAELAPPDDPQVARWTAKLTRVAELTDQLQPLTRGEPPPVNAAEMLTELADRWVGQDDPQVRTGRARLHRITELRQALMPLGSAWVIPAELPVERYLQELMTLVGPNDPQVSAWVRRARILNGPPKPTWAAAAGHDRFGPWVEAPVMGIRLRLRLVPGGTSLVGSGTSEPGRRAEEAISHAVTVTSFWLAETEVSQALAAALFQEGNCTYTGARLPLESVSWDDALRLLAALGTVVPGMEPRLPTADEWEYACRAGNLAPWSGPDGEQPENRLDQVAWFAGRAGTHPVGYLLPNRLGLYDMHGNVWEWVEASDLRAANRRLLCGGSWADPADRLRAAARAQAEPELRSRLVGMRIAAPARWPAGDNPEAPMPVAGVKPAK
jgi:formylglycine-generating enzyme required for sulfatase activity